MKVGELLELLATCDRDEPIRIEFYHEESDSKVIAEITDVGWDNDSDGYLIREE